MSRSVTTLDKESCVTISCDVEACKTPQKGTNDDERRIDVKPKAKKIKVTHRVRWTTDTLDNEHSNKKKSKVCCIYHKVVPFGESSSEESSSEESDSSKFSENCRKERNKS